MSTNGKIWENKNVTLPGTSALELQHLMRLKLTINLKTKTGMHAIGRKLAPIHFTERREEFPK